MNSLTRIGKIVAGFCLIGAVLACQESKGPVDTTNTGLITVAADQALQPVLEAEEMTFEATHKYAKINSVYVSELKAIEMLLNDSARVAIITRELNAKELKILAEQKYLYHRVKIAIDAVALISNGANPDTLLTTTQLKQILTGQITQWSQLGKRKESGKITVVFDNNSSSNLTYLLDTLQIKDRSKAPIFAVNTSEEVINFVKKNPSALGIIGVNWISDSDDPKTPRFMEGIHTMAVARAIDPDPDEYYRPFQYNLALNRYPLSRHVIMVTKESRQGLGTGYINYVAGEQGQRIILKAGLLPATQILRLVNTHAE